MTKLSPASENAVRGAAKTINRVAGMRGHGDGLGRGGGFSYLFPTLQDNPDNLLPLLVDSDGTRRQDPAIQQALAAMADTMVDANPADPAGDSPIPAGYTYLGQFLDHDLTLDPTSRLQGVNQPDAVPNFRQPYPGLDSLYGRGPANDRFLFDQFHPLTPGLVFFQQPGRAHDVPRVQANANGTVVVPLIGDPRNDENLAVAQTHVLFLHFHNRVTEHLAATTTLRDLALFQEAYRLVAWHYQWIIARDFLPRLCRPADVDDVVANGPRYFRASGCAHMPVEFSAAAFRLGHSMVRENYNFNDPFSTATLSDLFSFTGGGPSGPPPSNWRINWSRFFDLGTGGPVNLARRIDTQIVSQLHNLPPPVAGAGPVNLPARNLARGYALNLPSGQAVAAYLGVNALTNAEIQFGREVLFAQHPLLLQRTPLWFYVLRESEVRESGERLGPVGSRIVADVILGLMWADRKSVLWHPEWTPPGLGGTTAGRFEMADLVRVAGAFP